MPVEALQIIGRIFRIGKMGKEREDSTYQKQSFLAVVFVVLLCEVAVVGCYGDTL